jgi:predicted PurR-regulated permease PerM
MKQSTIKPKNIIILILNILLFFIIIYGLFYKKKEREGFADEIKKITKGISEVTNTVGEIPKEINNISNKLNEEMQEMGRQIENKVLGKITSIFTQIGDMFNEGLIKPLGTLFTAIGNVFVQLFSIIKMIGNKIGSLPGCIIIYAIQSTIDTMFFVYRQITPSFIRSNLSIVYKYTLGYIFDFIGWLTGYTAAVKSCYGFNVSDEVDKINSGFKNAQQSFANNFGKLDFSKIKV